MVSHKWSTSHCVTKDATYICDYGDLSKPYVLFFFSQDMYTHAHMHTYIHTYLHSHIYACIQTDRQTHTHTRMHTHVCTHMCAHTTHTHTFNLFTWLYGGGDVVTLPLAAWVASYSVYITHAYNIVLNTYLQGSLEAHKYYAVYHLLRIHLHKASKSLQ